MEPARTLYEILQVDPRAEPEVLEAAFRRLARKYHPDISGTTEGDRRMRELNAAYEVLRDPRRREQYDRALFEPDDFAPGGQAGQTVEPEPVRQTWIACRQHSTETAVATCISCGAGLCEHCFARSQPARCLTCARAWEQQPRYRYLLPALWFFIVLGAMAYLVANSSWLVAHRAP